MDKWFLFREIVPVSLQPNLLIISPLYFWYSIRSSKNHSNNTFLMKQILNMIAGLIVPGVTRWEPAPLLIPNVKPNLANQVPVRRGR